MSSHHVGLVLVVYRRNKQSQKAFGKLSSQYARMSKAMLFDGVRGKQPTTPTTKMVIATYGVWPLRGANNLSLHVLHQRHSNSNVALNDFHLCWNTTRNPENTFPNIERNLAINVSNVETMLATERYSDFRHMTYLLSGKLFIAGKLHN